MAAARFISAPPVVAPVCGAVVAAVSWTMGVVAHGMAADAPGAVSRAGLVAALLASALVGVGAAGAVRRLGAGTVAPAALVLGQAAVHYALAWTHDPHGSGGQAVHSAAAYGAHPVSGHAGHDHMSWPMFVAHAVATVVAGGALILVSHWLRWLGARITVPSGLPLIRAEDVGVVSTTGRMASPVRFLISPGGLRGPPLPV